MQETEVNDIDSNVYETVIVGRGHSRPVVDVCSSEIVDDSFWILSSSKDNTIMLRNGETGDWVGTLKGHKGAICSSTFDKTASKVCSASADFTVKYWNAITGKELQTFNHSHIVKSCNFSPDCDRILTGGKDKLIRIYDLQKPEKEISSFSGHTSTINCVKYLKNENVFISSSDDKTIKLWDQRISNSIKTMTFDSEIPEFKIINSTIAVPTSNSVKFLDLNFELIDEINDLPNQLESIALSNNEDVLITCGEDCDVRIYSMKKKKEIESHKGHHGIVHSITFSPKNDCYISGSDDSTIRIHTLKKINSE
eukprot:gene10330-2746_t